MREKDMIELIKSKDEKGAEEFLRTYTPLMRYIIAPILQNPHDQEECILDDGRAWEEPNAHIIYSNMTYVHQKGKFQYPVNSAKDAAKNKNGWDEFVFQHVESVLEPAFFFE